MPVAHVSEPSNWLSFSTHPIQLNVIGNRLIAIMARAGTRATSNRKAANSMATPIQGRPS